MAVLLDAEYPATGPLPYSGQQAYGSFSPWTHTPIGTPTAVAVKICYYPGGGAVSGVTYGGVSMTKFVSTTNANTDKIEIWGLANPPSGAQTVAITVSGATGVASSTTVTGSDTTTCFSNTSSNSGTSTHATTICTSATGELVIDLADFDDVTTGATGSSDSPQTALLYAQVGGGGTLVALGSCVAGASSITMGATASLSKAWGIVAASFKAPGGLGGGFFARPYYEQQGGLNV